STATPTTVGRPSRLSATTICRGRSHPPNLHRTNRARARVRKETQPMSTRCYVGVHHADTATISVRYVHSDGTPGYMVPALRAIWRDTFAWDTAAMAAALLANSWDYLGVDVTAASTSPFDDERPVAGVGMTIGVEPDDQTLTIAMSGIGSLDIGWVYLIDPADPTGAATTIYSAGNGDEPVARPPPTG